MDDENCKECYDCKSVFTAWRRKHHCRICGVSQCVCVLTFCSPPTGQIFCARCASNIIKGSRFGHDGLVRVCNLCLEKLAKVDDDDDDDRRSVISSLTTSFPVHQFGLESLGYHPQSPFAASQLFSRTDEPFNLYSIAETKRPRSMSDINDPPSRPITPHHTRDRSDYWEPVAENPAPFRRPLSEEDKESLSNPFSTENSPGAKTPVDFPIMPPNTHGYTSSIQFPIGSPDYGQDSPMQMRQQFNTYADLDDATPFIRSRVQSRLDNIVTTEPGWRTRRESTA